MTEEIKSEEKTAKLEQPVEQALPKVEKKTMEELKADLDGKKTQGKRKPKEPPKFVQTTGKRKRSIARAVTKPGKGIIKVNSIPLVSWPYEMVRLRMMEPLILSGEAYKGFDVSVNVKGGGQWGQADAVRQAISKGLVEYLPELKERFVAYDRNLLVYDPRRTEPHKPPHSSWGPRRYKQRSKR